MTLTLSLEQITSITAGLVGGKAAALAELARLGYRVPPSLVCTTPTSRSVAGSNS